MTAHSSVYNETGNVDSGELALGGGISLVGVLQWALNRVITKIDAEIEQLAGNIEAVTASLHELELTVARLEARHKR